jgi:hypothetical protein
MVVEVSVVLVKLAVAVVVGYVIRDVLKEQK